MAQGLGSLKELFKSAAPVLGAIAGSFIPGVGALGPAIGSFAGSKLGGRSTTDSLINAGIAGLGGYMLGNTQAAQAGGYSGGMGFGGSSLGSSLWTGAGKEGIGSLLQGRTAAGGMTPAATGAGTGGGSHAENITKVLDSDTGKAMAAKGFSSGDILKAHGLSISAPQASVGGGGIGDLITKNPLAASALISGGLYMLNKNEPQWDPTKSQGPRGADLLAANPSKYGFNPKNFGMAEGGMVNGYAMGGPVASPQAQGLYGQPPRGPQAMQGQPPDQMQGINQAQQQAAPQGLQGINQAPPLPPTAPLPPPRPIEPPQMQGRVPGQLPPGLLNRAGGLPPGLLNRAGGMPQGLGGLRPQMQRPQISPQMAMYASRRPFSYGGHVAGSGGPTDDQVPAALSDGEFVFTADAVRGAGGGDRMKGAARMYKMMKQYEKKMESASQMKFAKNDNKGNRNELNTMEKLRLELSPGQPGVLAPGQIQPGMMPRLTPNALNDDGSFFRRGK